jgi:carbon-monoxide dehydrogenase medium subunit/xanthine dehydrogenase FAD-binding subunit
MATVGGNVANSSPSGDTIAPLTALEAVIHTITSKDNKICEKETPITEFITGVGKNLLEKGEVISSITCPVLKEYGCAFKKVGLRRSLCISTASSAFLVKADASKTHFEDVRIAFGAIGPVPRRLTEIEDRLKGEVISKERIQKMREYIPEDVVRSRSRKEYRRNVVENFTLAGIYEALAEIGIIPQ